MKREMICIVCPAGCRLSVGEGGAVSGYTCPRGLQYAQTEITAPKRVVSSTVRLLDGEKHSRLPVKLNRPVDKELVREAVRQLNGVAVSAPVRTGDIVLENVLGTGADFIATKSVARETV